MPDIDIQAAIKQIQAGIDQTFPKATGPEVEKLQARLQALKAEMDREPPPAPEGQFTPLAGLRMYGQLKEILLLYKQVIVPILADLEKQRLDTVAHMARFMESRR